jgi:hypothetical protein
MQKITKAASWPPSSFSIYQYKNRGNASCHFVFSWSPFLEKALNLN